MAAGHLRHGREHRKQAGALRVLLAKAAVWRIRIPEYVVRFQPGMGFHIPPNAEVEYFHEPSRMGNAVIVRTKAGTVLTYREPLPDGVTVERIK